MAGLQAIFWHRVEWLFNFVFSLSHVQGVKFPRPDSDVAAGPTVKNFNIKFFSTIRIARLEIRSNGF